jgi:hypothetical protein
VEHPVPRYTFLAFVLTRAIDEGQSITVDDAYAAIRDGSLFDLLREHDVDVSPYLDHETEPLPGVRAGERRTMLKVLEAVSGESRYGVENNGLALILACCIEVLQQPDAFGDERFDE